MGKKRILTGLLLICVMVFAGFLTMLVKTLIPYGEADEVYEEIGRASVQMASEIGGGNLQIRNRSRRCRKSARLQ